jgi:hypothetical protein
MTGALGAGMPAALREAYLLFGQRADLTAVQDRLVPPGDLSLGSSRAMVIFRRENQNCAAWAVAAADLDFGDGGRDDPPVYESGYERLAVPEHPAWYDPGMRIRWFSAPGKLLRVDGHAPRGTLMAAGQTPADLEDLRATLPGAWNSVRWPDRELMP